MKKVITIGVFLLNVFAANAQVVRFGPEAGVNLGSMAIRENDIQEKPMILPGLKAGAIADIAMNEMVAIQPGLFYIRKGYKEQGINFTTTNIELPLNFQFKFPLGAGYYFAGGGPYAAYILRGDYSQATSTSSETNINRGLAIGNGATDDIRPLDLGLNLNTGYLLSNGLFLRGNAGFGLANLQPGGTNTNSLRNFSLAFTVGYMAGKSFRSH